jgi:hypothetical protein
MRMPERPLNFSAVDELGFAAAAGQLDIGNLPARYVVTRLGPLLELLCLVGGGRLPSELVQGWLVPNGAERMLASLQSNHQRWISNNGRLGFIRARRTGTNADTYRTGFLMDAQHAAREGAHLPGNTPGQLAAAIEEMENNIHEHSNAADTGIVAFRAVPGMFEVVAADRGMGILDSLRSCPAFSAMTDHGKALEAALTDGTSRFGVNAGRGHGFRPVFLSLMNMYGTLRFRSGDHALIMDGTTPDISTAQLAQKPRIDGFFASVMCRKASAC